MIRGLWVAMIGIEIGRLTQLCWPSGRKDLDLGSGQPSEAPAALADARPSTLCAAAVLEAQLDGLERLACSGERRDDHGTGEAF